LVYFTAIWYILWTLGIFCGKFGIFFRFWLVLTRKIWQPWQSAHPRISTLSFSFGFSQQGFDPITWMHGRVTRLVEFLCLCEFLFWENFLRTTYISSTIFLTTFYTGKAVFRTRQNVGWASFRTIFLTTHPVALMRGEN
jgi:hypothetical protein